MMALKLMRGSLTLVQKLQLNGRVRLSSMYTIPMYFACRTRAEGSCHNGSVPAVFLVPPFPSGAGGRR
jgi:hypothetical protein